MANMYQDEEIILKVKELTNKIKEDKLYQDYMKLRQELKKVIQINLMAIYLMAWMKTIGTNSWQIGLPNSIN